MWLNISENYSNAMYFSYQFRLLLQPLIAPDLESHEFVSLAFSPDSKYLIAQGGKPDWTLVYWAWEKGKIMATMKTTNQTGQPVYQVRVYLIFSNAMLHFFILTI